MSMIAGRFALPTFLLDLAICEKPLVACATDRPRSYVH
jgi:hypothetical protein